MRIQSMNLNHSDFSESSSLKVVNAYCQKYLAIPFMKPTFAIPPILLHCRTADGSHWMALGSIRLGLRFSLILNQRQGAYMGRPNFRRPET